MKERSKDLLFLGATAVEAHGVDKAFRGVHAVSDEVGGVALVEIPAQRAQGGGTEVAVRGWEQGTGRSVADVLDELEGAGLAAVVVTAIDRDGTLGGPDLEGLRDVLGATTLPVIASGGIGSTADVAALAALGGPDPAAPDGGIPRRLAGAITGRALVDGRMTVEEGVAACAPSV